MPVRELYVIFNPAADRGRIVRRRAELERLLDLADVRWELVPTERRGHAAELAEAAARAGWEAVVAVGGDGVVHEVANGLLRAAGGAPTVPLGVIAAGTGNDFVKLLGLPARDPAGALRRILAAEPRPVDAGAVVRCVAERAPAGVWYFVNGVGLGFDAQVANEASRIRRLRGIAIYLLAVFRTLRRLGAPHVTVEVDGATVADRPLVLTTVANGACHGGSFWLTPDARLDDGALDVLVADARPVRDVVRLIPAVLKGEMARVPGAQFHRGRRIRIRSEHPLPIHADGEIVAAGVREIEMEVLAGRLRVLA